MHQLQLNPIVKPEDFYYEIIRLYNANKETATKASVSNTVWEGKGELLYEKNGNIAILTDIFYKEMVRYNIPYRLEANWLKLLFIRIDNHFYRISFETLRKNEIIIENKSEFTYENEINRIWLQQANTRMQMITIYLSAEYLNKEWRCDITTIEKKEEETVISSKSVDEQLLNLLFDDLNSVGVSDDTNQIINTLIENSLSRFFFGEDIKNKNITANIKEAEIELLKNLKFPPSIATLSKIAGMNRVKFQQLFTEHFGSTVYQYYQKKRFEYAKKLIEQLGYSVSDAAYTIGYKHLGHFSQTFTKMYGIKPSDVKSNYKKK